MCLNVPYVLYYIYAKCIVEIRTYIFIRVRALKSAMLE